NARFRSGGSAHASGAAGPVTIVVVLNRQVGGVQALEIGALIIELEHAGPGTTQTGWEFPGTAHTHAGATQIADPAGAQLVLRADLTTQRHQVQCGHRHGDGRQGPDTTTEDKPQNEGHNDRDTQAQEGALTADVLVVGEFPVGLGIVVTTSTTTGCELHVRLGQFPGLIPGPREPTGSPVVSSSVSSTGAPAARAAR